MTVHLETKTFELNAKEQQRADEFMASRRSEPGGPIGGQFSIKFTMTSVADIVTIRDEASNEFEDITDYDLF